MVAYWYKILLIQGGIIKGESNRLQVKFFFAKKIWWGGGVGGLRLAPTNRVHEIWV